MTRPLHPIAAWRKRMGLTQPELAGLLGVSITTVVNWERGYHPAPSYLWLALAALEDETALPVEAGQR